MMKSVPKIIIADDVSIMRRLLKNSLLNAGFSEVTEAGNGTDLLQKLEQSSFDLIICDWDMPKMSGLQALKLIKQHDDLNHIPFVMVTAVTDMAHVKEAIELGIHDYIAKPVQPDVFIRKIKKIIAGLNSGGAATA